MDDTDFVLPDFDSLPDLESHQGAPGTASDPWIGRLVAGRFRVESFVAAGGIGRVYRARQEDLDRVVALKVLHPHLAHEDREKKRFHLEARVASRLKHPSALVIHDHGEWEGSLYLVMEFLEGRTLAAILSEEYPLDPARIVRLLSPACEVLNEAHEAGILHRDVKPANLFVIHDVDGSERTKLVDFGMLRDLKRGPAELGLTPADLVAGTPAYMSPEQSRGGTLDRRSDVYALGIVLYEILAGRLPFQGENPVDILLKQLYEMPEPPSKRQPGVEIPPAFEALCLRALAKNAADRPQTALAFRDELQAALERTLAGPAPLTPREERATAPRARIGRADAVGIVPVEPRTALNAGVRSLADVLVIEPMGPFDRTLTALLRVRGYGVDDAVTMDDGLAFLDPDRTVAVIVDVRPDPMGLLDRIQALRDAGPLGSVPVVVVGPEDSLAPMARALDAGVRDYVAESRATAQLPRVLDALVRARKRRPPAGNPGGGP